MTQVLAKNAPTMRNVCAKSASVKKNDTITCTIQCAVRCCCPGLRLARGYTIQYNSIFKLVCPRVCAHPIWAAGAKFRGLEHKIVPLQGRENAAACAKVASTHTLHTPPLAPITALAQVKCREHARPCQTRAITVALKKSREGRLKKYTRSYRFKDV